jgi:hypothetical protein
VRTRDRALGDLRLHALRLPKSAQCPRLAATKRHGRPLVPVLTYEQSCTCEADALAAEEMATNNEDPSGSLDKDFCRAIANFEASAKLTDSEKQEFRHTTLEKFQAAMASLQTRQAQTKKLQFMNRLEPFIETITEYGKAIDVFSNTSEVLSFIWVRSHRGPRTFPC